MSPVVSRTSVPAGPREEHLADALFAAARAIKHGLRPELEREGLTAPMFWALNQLVLDGPLSVGALAGACVVTPPNVSAVADDLEAAGLVSRSSSSRDRRVVVLTVTPRGRALHRAVSRRVAGFLLESTRGLPAADLDATGRVLSRLAGLPSGSPTASLEGTHA
jgi:MarR family transcriptional regulator, organic hydroperoxide resistance regulator